VTIVSGTSLDDGVTGAVITSLAADSTNVYWSYNGCGIGVKQATGAGAAPIQLANTGPGPAQGLSVSGSAVAFVMLSNNSGGAYFCTATVGGQLSAVCSTLLGNYYGSGWTTPGLPGTFDMLATGGYVDGPFYLLSSCIVPASADGGAPCSGLTLPSSLNIGAGYLAYASPSKTLFWSEGGTHVAYNHLTTNTAGYASNASGGVTFPVVTDGSKVYWIDNSSEILQVAAQPTANQTPNILAGSTASPLAIPSSNPTLATDGTYIYFAATAPKGSGLYYIPVSGGSPTLLAASLGTGTPQNAVVGGAFVYWNEATPSNVIRRVATP
jgi:hypothetical protein